MGQRTSQPQRTNWDIPLLCLVAIIVAVIFIAVSR